MKQRRREGSVAVLHVAVLKLSPLLATNVFVFRLGLFSIAPFVLDDVLRGKTRHGICTVAALRVSVLCGGKAERGRSYVAWQELDDHAHDEHGPEDVQSLQHEHEPVEEVEAEEGGIEEGEDYEAGDNENGSKHVFVRWSYKTRAGTELAGSTVRHNSVETCGQADPFVSPQSDFTRAPVKIHKLAMLQATRVCGVSDDVTGSQPPRCRCKAEATAVEADRASPDAAEKIGWCIRLTLLRDNRSCNLYSGSVLASGC
ncbi:hypothetical protein EYF80_029793 [Liparis tanakae]|uniref:Uncharacterized protein n=1 Tax=Liparis tanakae TaxID=230148 RepID=A0A4Z2H2Y2_9TELE|nr:hypothetical protein EYF80_029793 [Liparis tanakae]